MQQKLLLPFLPLLLFISSLRAQVAPPCPTPPPPGAESCQAACVYCNFDGYMGINNGTPSGGNTVCNQIAIHNDQWFGFVAGTSSITIDILTSNCLNGDGLQAAFFDDCNEDAIVCNPGSGGGAGVPLTLNYSGFVPGQTYFLMIDGWSGDVCDFEIDVTDGSVTPPPPAPPTPPQGPKKVCPGAVVEYTVDEVFGAGYYTWTAPAGAKINGGTNSLTLPAPDGTTVTITFGNAGGNVCVKVGNACFPPVQACITVVNQPIPPTQLPTKIICYEDLPFTWEELPNNYIVTSGTFNLTSSPYDSYLGCDSVIKQTIIVKPLLTTNLGLKYICQGSCLTVNGNEYCDPGTYTEVFQSFQGCDSIVTFSIAVVPALAEIGPPGTISCTNPSIVLNSNGSSSGPNVFYSWRNDNWGVLGAQPTQTVNSGGTYYLIVSGVAGGITCKDTAMVTVPSTVLPPGASAQGGVLTCQPNGQTVTLQGSSPTNGTNFLWSGPGITPANQNLPNPAVSATGTYVLTVTNPVNGCTSTATASVTANNTPPSASAIGGTILCTQPSITVNSTTDAPNATFNWAGPGINGSNQHLEDPVVTTAGTYTVTITNAASGCTNTATASVDENTATPTASAGNDQTITCTQPNITLNGNGSPANVTYNWNGPGITPANQTLPAPNINQPGTYVLTVTNPVNGCIKTDTTAIDALLTPPDVDAGANQTITCAITSVVLGSNGTSQGPNFQANWTGPGINPGNQNQFTPTVNQSGAYVLTVTNTTSGCTATDNVAIALNIANPTANAGTDQILTCTTTNGVTLNGAGSPANVTYLWSGPGIGANNENLQNPQVTQPGDYAVQVTDPVNGCTATDQVQVQQDANVPTANAGPDLTLNCAVSAVNIDASGSSGGAGISYQWTGPGITPANETTLSPSAINLPGTYTLIVNNTTNNCKNTDILVIAIDTITPAANAGTDLILNCYNKGVDTLDASASSTGTDFTYLWTGADINTGNQNSLTPAVSQAGTYNLLVTNTVNHCTATDIAVVTDDQTHPTASAGNDQTIDCVTLTTVLGGTSSSGAGIEYLWSGPAIHAGNKAVAQPTVDKPGLYTLVVTNTTNGCTATDDATVTLNAVYPTATAGPDITLTCAQPTQTLDGAGSSTGANFQALWSGPGINTSNQNQLSPGITLPGTYILAVTDIANSCISKDTVVVAENKTVPAASAGPDNGLDCKTTSTVLDGSGSSTGTDFVYLWTGPGISTGNQNTNSPTVTQPGQYVLLVTNAINGCTSTDMVQISQDIVAPAASAGQDITLTCAQNALAIDGSGSSAGALFEYLWQGPGINTGNFNVQNPVVNLPGTYTVTVTNTQNHCTATDFVVVSQDAAPPVANGGADQTLTCAKTSLPLDGSGSQTGANISYNWSGPGIQSGQNTNTAIISLPGAYTLTVTNTGNGCTSTDIVNVNEDVLPPFADAGTDQTLTCATTSGVTISAAASNTGAGFSLQWSGPGINAGNQNLISPTVSIPGTYTVTVTNTTNGCTSTDSADVGQDQNLPNASAGEDQTLSCAIQQVTLDASGSTGNGTLQAVWSGPGINAGNQSEWMPVVTQAGTYTVTVTSSITGCKASDNVQVFLDNQPPQVTTTGGLITCTNLLATINATSSLPGSTFSWTGPDIDPGNMNLPNPQVEEPGNYTVVVTAPNGCTASATAVVKIDSNVPTGNAEGTQLNCTNNGQSTISGTVDTPGATFSWTGPGGFSASTLDPIVTASGTYTFTIISQNGCKKTYTAEVTSDFAKPAVNVSVKDKLDCSTTQLTISGAGTSVGQSFSYEWTTTDGHFVSGTNSLQPVVDDDGVYTLLVTNLLNGCTNTGTVTVEYDPAVPTALDLTIQHIRCFGEQNGSITINGVVGGTQPFLYSFNGGVASGTAQFPKLGEGIYTLSLEDANGCILDTMVTITAPGALTVDLEDNVFVPLGTPVTVKATVSGTTPLASITWSPAAPCATADCLSYDTIPIYSYLQTITVKDENGCISTDRQLIQVDRTRRIYIPTVFNIGSNDPANAVLMIHGGDDVRKIKTWQIFDRWGNAIFVRNNFQPNDPTNAWDGKIRGDEGASAVYVWYLEAEFIDGEVEAFKGDVTLLKK